MTKTLAEGRFLKLSVRENGWEFAERTTIGGAVVIVPLTDDGRVILVEQFRPPVQRNVIEFPAGLVGDRQEFEGERMDVAAERELLEETGYAAEQLEQIASGPPSAGMSNEVVHFFVATGLRKVGDGGGDDSEDITIHEVALADLPKFLSSARRRGLMIDPKIYAGLYFLGGVSTGAAEPISISIGNENQRLDSPTGLQINDPLFERLDAVLPQLPEGGRVGILGGTFNPPHVGHALLAHAMLATEAIDELWIVPVFEHPFGKNSADFSHRVAMCKKAFAMLGDRVRVVEIERELPSPSYTVQTLSALHAVRAGIAPTLIIGSDIVPDLHRWQDPDKLPVLSKLVVVPRQGAPTLKTPDDFPMKVHRGFRLPKVSSTAIKKALSGGETVDGLLDLSVLNYIREHGLYRG